MVVLDSEVQKFNSELRNIRDTRSLVAAFEALISHVGCKYFVISGIPDDNTNLQDLLIAHNLPEDWVSEYLLNNYVACDPIVRHCTEVRDPFYWREAIDATAAAKSRNVMLRAEQFGLTNGVCFPIHNINGFEAGVSVSGSPNPLQRTEIRALYLASVMAFNALRRIRIDHSLRIEAISQRECEILTWSALGRTSKEIAYILFLSENTVNVHIKNAINKLSAKNKTEAVAIAVRKGIISIYNSGGV